MSTLPYIPSPVRGVPSTQEIKIVKRTKPDPVFVTEDNLKIVVGPYRTHTLTTKNYTSYSDFVSCFGKTDKGDKFTPRCEAENTLKEKIRDLGYISKRVVATLYCDKNGPEYFSSGDIVLMLYKNDLDIVKIGNVRITPNSLVVFNKGTVVENLGPVTYIIF